MTLQYVGYNRRCRQLKVSDPKIKERFANSKEVTEYLPMMYPIAENQFSSKAIMNESILTIVCDNSPHPNVKRVTEGLISDVSFAESYAIWNHFGRKVPSLEAIEKNLPKYTKELFPLFNKKYIVIVSRKYLDFHGLKETNGFIITPTIKRWEKVG